MFHEPCSPAEILEWVSCVGAQLQKNKHARHFRKASDKRYYLFVDFLAIQIFAVRYWHREITTKIVQGPMEPQNLILWRLISLDFLLSTASTRTGRFSGTYCVKSSQQVFSTACPSVWTDNKSIVRPNKIVVAWESVISWSAAFAWLTFAPLQGL